MRIKHLIPLCVCVWLGACVKDKPQVTPNTPIVTTTNDFVLTINEGNFGSANASLGVWENNKQSYSEDVYKAANNASCGDVLQSVCKQGTNYYLVVNNSAKILVCNSNFLKVAEINGLTSPRYMQVISPAKAYVSDLYANGITVLNLNTNTVSGKIACKGWTENMAMLYNKVFVTNVNSKFLYVVNTVTDKLEDSVEVGENASGVLIDKAASVWVLLRANTTSSTSKLVQIDAVSNKVLKEIEISGNASDLKCNLDGSLLYFIHEGIGVYDIAKNETKQLLNLKGTFYGLGVEPATGNLFLADAKDYTQRSDVFVYSAEGTAINSFKAGVNCNGFYFK